MFANFIMKVCSISFTNVKKNEISVKCKIENNIKEIGIIFGVITSEIREFFKQEFNLIILTN